MKTIIFSILALSLIAGTSCQDKTELSNEQKETIENEIKDQQNQFLTTLNQLNIDSFPEFWNTDEMPSSVSDMTYFPMSTLVDSALYWFSLRERQHLEQRELKITALTPDIALMTNEIIWEVWMKSGKYSKSKVIATLIWKKKQDGWKVIHLHENIRGIEENKSFGEKESETKD